MTGGDAPDPAPDEPTTGSPTETRAERRRRLARVFGDVLPEQTSDDRPDSAEDPGAGGGDDWLRAQVPPHHG